MGNTTYVQFVLKGTPFPKKSLMVTNINPTALKFPIIRSPISGDYLTPNFVISVKTSGNTTATVGGFITAPDGVSPAFNSRAVKNLVSACNAPVNQTKAQATCDSFYNLGECDDDNMFPNRAYTSENVLQVSVSGVLLAVAGGNLNDSTVACLVGKAAGVVAQLSADDQKDRASVSSAISAPKTKKIALVLSLLLAGAAIGI